MVQGGTAYVGVGNGLAEESSGAFHGRTILGNIGHGLYRFWPTGATPIYPALLAGKSLRNRRESILSVLTPLYRFSMKCPQEGHLANQWGTDSLQNEHRTLC